MNSCCLPKRPSRDWHRVVLPLLSILSFLFPVMLQDRLSLLSLPPFPPQQELFLFITKSTSTSIISPWVQAQLLYWGLGLWLNKGVTPPTKGVFSFNMVASELLSVHLCAPSSGNPRSLLRALDGSSVGKSQTLHSIGNPCVSSGQARLPSCRWCMNYLGLCSC